MPATSLRLGRNATTAQKTKAFIAKARAVHGGKYDYSKVRYVDLDTPVRVVCRRHGEFRPTPYNHTRPDAPSGCMACWREGRALKAKEDAKQKQQEFIARAKKLYGRKYDYSRVRYVNVDTPVKVVCGKHGAFFPTPWNHTRPVAPSGCPRCGDERGSKLIRDKHKALFVFRAMKVHGNAYDYSKTVYKTARSKLTIICAKHGPFSQVASSHLRGIGCPVCGRTKAGASVRKAARKEFLAKARRVHGRNYRYDKTVYVRASGKIVVTCLKHGDFTQSANGHLNGYGCRKCQADTLRAAFADTKADFIRKARKKHGDKFTYAGKYVNSRTPMLIRCKLHGEFRQKPINHVKGTGCPKCGQAKLKFVNLSNHEEFLKKARAVHGSRFRYPQRYERATRRLRITCPIHGDFEQTPNAHLSGSGCKKCQSDQAAERNRLTHDTFVRKAQRIHGNKFKYPEKYHASIKPIAILCPVHGEFRQTPNSHLGGSGCPRCMESLGERLISRILERRRLSFATQHKFPDCVDKRPLRFDFWLPRLATLIEYDGPQHYEARGYYGGDAHFEATKRRDRIKTAYARKKKIRLIRVKYSVRDVEAFLVKRLGLGSNR